MLNAGQWYISVMNIHWFTFNLNLEGNLGDSIKACTRIRNCEIWWGTHFMNHFNLVCNNSASLVMASQGGNHKPGIWKNFIKRNMSFIFWSEGQRVDMKEKKNLRETSPQKGEEIEHVWAEIRACSVWHILKLMSIITFKTVEILKYIWCYISK